MKGLIERPQARNARRKASQGFNNNHMTPNFLKMNKNVSFEEITVIMPTNCLSQNGPYNPL